MTFREYLAIARERWLILVSALVIGLGLGSAVAFLSTPQYVASVKFFIATPDLGRNLNEAYQGSLLSEQKIKSYVELAGDRRVREQVSEAMNAPILPGVISASAKPDTVLLMLSAHDSSAVRAQQIVNLAAAAFGHLVDEFEKPDAGNSLVEARELEPAQLPTEPVSPRRKTDLALGLLLGLMAGIAGAVGRHTLDRSVKTPEELAELTGAPVLGSTQYDPSIRQSPLIVHDQPRSPLAEAFRQLRTNLDYVDLDHRNKLIVITSALPYEGKTTTACNLAIAMAQAGSKVLVVEADLRRPKAAEYLGLENTVGLTSVLTGQVPIEVAIQPWRGGLMDFLGAGPLPPNPSELLASSQMMGILNWLNDHYDFVIFDAAPALPVADAAVLAAHAHGVLFVARHGRVQADQVKAAAEMMQRVSARIFGAVLSMTPRAKRGDGYSYQYNYIPNKKIVRAAPAPVPVAEVKLVEQRTDLSGHYGPPPPRTWGAETTAPSLPAPRSTSQSPSPSSAESASPSPSPSPSTFTSPAPSASPSPFTSVDELLSGLDKYWKTNGDG